MCMISCCFKLPTCWKIRKLLTGSCAWSGRYAIEWRPKGQAAPPNRPARGFTFTNGFPGGVKAALEAAAKRAAEEVPIHHVQRAVHVLPPT